MTRNLPWLLWTVACSDPLLNEPPRLVRYNGLDFDTLWQLRNPPELLAEAGEDFIIELEVRDPEGDAFRIWFPRAPPGLEFDPDETQGVWHVPEDPSNFMNGLQVVLEEVGREFPRNENYWLPVQFGDYSGLGYD